MKKKINEMEEMFKMADEKMEELKDKTLKDEELDQVAGGFGRADKPPVRRKEKPGQYHGSRNGSGGASSKW